MGKMYVDVTLDAIVYVFKGTIKKRKVNGSLIFGSAYTYL